MFFTQDDYKKIQQWLIKNSVKDTEFSEANIPFNGEETITIVQGNQNKKVFLKDLIAQVFNLGISDFVNITDKYDAPNISLEEAIRLIPSRARKEGQVITFLDKEDHWHIYQFKGVLNQWNVLDTWEDLFDWENLIIDSILPDEEDLTKSLPDENGNSYLSLKDREYNPKDFSGLGRIILRKNIVEIEDPIYGKVKKNVLYQDMFTQSNTVYECRYDFDLNGQDIILPDNSYIEYNGGSISNGNIIDNAKGLNKIILRKNIKEGKNILTQDMINKENIIYEIRYDFDLNGAEITIPEGCVLDFQGGSLSNGNINLPTLIEIKGVPIIQSNISNIDIKNNETINVDSFGADNTGLTDSTKQIQTAITVGYLLHKDVEFTANGTYLITDFILCYDNTTLRGNGSNIKVNTFDDLYFPFNSDRVFTNYIADYKEKKNKIVGKKNIKIEGFNFINESEVSFKYFGVAGYDPMPRGTCAFRGCTNIDITNCNFDFVTGPTQIWLVDINGSINVKNNISKTRKFGNQEVTDIDTFMPHGGFLWFYTETDTKCDCINIENNTIDTLWDEPIAVFPSKKSQTYPINIVNIVNNNIISQDVQSLTLGSNNQKWLIAKQMNVINNNICGSINLGYGIENIEIKGNNISNEHMIVNRKKISPTGNFPFNGNYDNGNKKILIRFQFSNSLDKWIYNNIIIENNNMKLVNLSDDLSYELLNIVSGKFDIVNFIFDNNNVGSEKICSLGFNLYNPITNFRFDNNIIFGCSTLFNLNVTEYININKNKCTIDDIFHTMKLDIYGTINNNIFVANNPESFKIVKGECRNNQNSKKILFSSNIIDAKTGNVPFNVGTAIYLKDNHFTNAGYAVFDRDNYETQTSNNDDRPINTPGAEYYNVTERKLYKQVIAGKWVEVMTVQDEIPRKGNIVNLPNSSDLNYKVYDTFNYINFDEHNTLLFYAGGNTWVRADGSRHDTPKIGTMEERPTNHIFDGYAYFDKSLGYPIYRNGTAWVNALGQIVGTKNAGLFDEKPNNPSTGFAYFCLNRQTAEGSTNGIMIYHKGNNVWVDALGRVVE